MWNPQLDASFDVIGLLPLVALFYTLNSLQEKSNLHILYHKHGSLFSFLVIVRVVCKIYIFGLLSLAQFDIDLLVEQNR